MRINQISFPTLVVIVVILGVIVGSVIGSNKEHDVFMSDCLKYERQYSCEVKWKQMHPDPVVVVAPFNN